MIHKKLFSLLVLLAAAVSGAWADETTTVTWGFDDLNTFPTTIYQGESHTVKGITVTVNTGSTNNIIQSVEGFGNVGFAAAINNAFTFSTELGNITKIECTTLVLRGELGDGWSGATWTGKAKSVNLGNANSTLVVSGITFTIEAASPDYKLTVGESAQGTIKFFVNEKEVKGANEGDAVTMTVFPDEGWTVGTVSATTYTTWAGSRRKAPAAVIPILGDVTLTAAEGAAGTWTFTMPAASVMASATYQKISTLYLNPADRTSLMEVKVDGQAATPAEGKIEKVLEGTAINLKAKTGYKFRKVEVKKGAAAAKTIIIGDVELTYADGDTWETIVSKNSDKIKTLAGRYIVQVAQPASNQYRYIHVWYTGVKPSDIIDPSKNYQWGTMEVDF